MIGSLAMRMLVGKMRSCSRNTVSNKFQASRMETAYWSACPPAGFWRANSEMTMVYDWDKIYGKQEYSFSSKPSNPLGTWRWRIVHSFETRQNYVYNKRLLRTQGVEARIWRKNLPVPVKVDIVSVAVASAGADHL